MAIGTPMQILTLRAPTLAILPSAVDYLALAETQTGQAFESNRNLAVALLAGHWLTCDALNTSISGGGFLISESEGSVSRTYQHAGAFTSSANDSLGSSNFGKELMALKKSCLFLPTNSFV